MLDAPWPSRAIAVLTQESIPPLKSTTALRESFFKSLFNSTAPAFGILLCEISAPSASPRCLFLSFFFTRKSNALGCRVPNELVQLQSQPHRQSVSQYPLHQHARLEARPLPLRIFEHRREQNLFHPPRQAVLRRKLARKLIIAPRGQHELHFIVFRQRLEIAHLEGIRLARIGTLHVHNLDDFSRQPSDEALPAGFDHDGVLRSEQLLRERINFFLQQGFPARQFD